MIAMAKIAPPAGDLATRGDASENALLGREVLLTRPRAQAAALVDAIAAAGGVAWRFPILSIEPVAEFTALDAALRRLADFDLVVFVSANAAEQAAARCAVLGLPGLVLVRCAATPGPGTASALARLGVVRVIAPSSRFDSDGLIEAIDAVGLKFPGVLILRGADEVGDGTAGSGRQQLGEWLVKHGAVVEVVASYRRSHVRFAAGEVDALLARRAPDALVVTSSEGGQRLVHLLGGKGLHWLRGVPTFVPHSRIAESMRAIGLADVHLTAGGDAGIMNGLIGHFRGRAHD